MNCFPSCCNCYLEGKQINKTMYSVKERIKEERKREKEKEKKNKLEEKNFFGEKMTNTG